MRSLRILAVCDDPPAQGLTTSAGHTLISAHVLPRLARFAELTVAYFARDPVPDWCLPVAGAVHLPLRSRGPLRPDLPEAVALRVGPGAVDAVARLSSGVDVTYLHGLGTFGLLAAAGSPVIVNEVDPWSLFWEDRMQATTGVDRALAWLRATRLRRVERQAADRADDYLLVNPHDAEDLGGRLGRRVTAIPNGVGPAPEGAAAPPVGELRVVFAGSLDYGPNVDSAVELCTRVMPLVRQAVPDARAVVAGRAPVDAVRRLAEEVGVEVVADPPDLSRVLATATVAAFPGGYGRGTRNSVLDALRCGVPVVASSASARGVRTGRHLRVADDAAAVARAIVAVHEEGVDGPARRAARVEGSALPDWDDAAAQYLALLSAAAVAGAGRRPVPAGDAGRHDRPA